MKNIKLTNIANTISVDNIEAYELLMSKTKIHLILTNKYSNKPLRLLESPMYKGNELNVSDEFLKMFLIVMTDNLVHYNVKQGKVEFHKNLSDTTVNNRRQYSGYSLTPNLIHIIVKMMMTTTVDQRASIIVMSSIINQLINEYNFSVNEIIEYTRYNTLLNLYKDITGVDSHPTSHKTIYNHQLDRLGISFKSSLRSERAMMTILTSNNSKMIHSLVDGLMMIDLPYESDLTDTRKIYDKIIPFM